MRCAFISSEESAEEGIDDETNHTLYVKPLPWREARVTKFIRQLDDKTQKRQSTRARRQTLPRKAGVVSTRPKPVTEFGANFWGFA